MTKLKSPASVGGFCQDNDHDFGVRRNPVSDSADGVAVRRGGCAGRAGW
jgi:hypothetical protein